jgi:hypothetical protein
MNTDTARSWIERLALQPHPEGGWYREVHRSTHTVMAEGRCRAALTTIYYLLDREQHSRWHTVCADEVWHFYAGAPLELLAYQPDTRQLTRTRLAADPNNGTLVSVVAANVWQAARPLGQFALVGCTVGPGFDFADFTFVCDVPGHAAHFSGALSEFADLL